MYYPKATAMGTYNGQSLWPVHVVAAKNHTYDTNVVYTSSDESVLQYDAQSNTFASKVEEGTATITATLGDDSVEAAITLVPLDQTMFAPIFTIIDDIRKDVPGTLVLKRNTSCQLNATLSRFDMNNMDYVPVTDPDVVKSIKWDLIKMGDEEVATLTSDGVLTRTGAGDIIVGVDIDYDATSMGYSAGHAVNIVNVSLPGLNWSHPEAEEINLTVGGDPKYSSWLLGYTDNDPVDVDSSKLTVVIADETIAHIPEDGLDYLGPMLGVSIAPSGDKTGETTITITYNEDGEVATSVSRIIVSAGN